MSTATYNLFPWVYMSTFYDHLLESRLLRPLKFLFQLRVCWLGFGSHHSISSSSNYPFKGDINAPFGFFRSGPVLNYESRRSPADSRIRTSEEALIKKGTRPGAVSRRSLAPTLCRCTHIGDQEYGESKRPALSNLPVDSDINQRSQGLNPAHCTVTVMLQIRVLCHQCQMIAMVGIEGPMNIT